MSKNARDVVPWLAAFVVAAAAVMYATPSPAATAAEITRDSQAALKKLYATNPRARQIGEKAIAVLVFPSVKKAGLGVGGQYGEGALIRGGKAVAYYNTAGASIGLQVGAQIYGYAMFFLSEETLAYLDKSQGFEVGVGPSVVLADEAFAKSTTTTTVKDNVYAFIFDNKGAMASIGLQGNKITRLNK